MDMEKIHPKVAALLALEAMIIESPPEAYQLDRYMRRTFRDIEKVLTAESPEGALSDEEFQTFQRLVTGYIGADRRREKKEAPSRRRRTDHLSAA